MQAKRRAHARHARNITKTAPTLAAATVLTLTVAQSVPAAMLTPTLNTNKACCSCLSIPLYAIHFMPCKILSMFRYVYIPFQKSSVHTPLRLTCTPQPFLLYTQPPRADHTSETSAATEVYCFSILKLLKTSVLKHNDGQKGFV